MICKTIALCVAMWLDAHGYDAPHARGVMNYVREESGFRPTLIERTGACLFQWAGSRRRDILALGRGGCPPWEVQMRFADRELRTTFRGFWRSSDPTAHMRNHFGAGVPDER